MEWLAFGGNVASLIGLVVTFLAYRKAKGAKQAAEEAKRETARAIERVGARLIESEVVTAARDAQRFLDACRTQHWPIALDRGDDLRTRISALQKNPRLGSKERRALGEFYDELRLVQEQIESFRADRRKHFVSGKSMDILLKGIGLLDQIEKRLRDESLKGGVRP